MQSLRIATLAVTFALCATASAGATTRYVQNGGSTDPNAPCDTPATPCNLAAAVDGFNTKVQSGDTVVVLGPDAIAVPELQPNKPLTIEGDPGSATRPVITSSSANTTVLSVDMPGTIVRHLDLRDTNPDHASALSVDGAIGVSDVHLQSMYIGATLAGGATLSDSTVNVFNQTNNNARGVQVTGPATVSNTQINASDDPGGLGVVALSATGPLTALDVQINTDGTAVAARAAATLRRLKINAPRGPGITFSGADDTLTDSLIVTTHGAAVSVADDKLTLRNVTALSSDHAGIEAARVSGDVQAKIDARNVIVRGGGPALDVVADSPPASCPVPPCSGGAVTIASSNFATASPTGITDLGHEQSGDPQFVDPAARDYHLQATSPAIDAGVADPLDGPTDLDGTAHTQGLAPDLGAYEFIAPAPAPGPGPGGGGSGPGSGSGTGGPGASHDTTAPTITRASLSHPRFAVAPGRTATTARTTRHKKATPRGTTIRFALSEPAAVALTFAKARSGRRKGKSCVAATRALRRAKPCTRYVALSPTLRRNEKRSGAQAVAFTGRLGPKRLATGRYQLTIQATDAASNRSKPKTVHFTIVAARRA